jgi:cytochrome c1
LQRHLETIPTVPEDAHMPNLALSSQELRDVVAFIVSLRDKPAAPAQ